MLCSAGRWSRILPFLAVPILVAGLARGPAEEAPAGRLGQKIANVTFRTAAGKPLALADFTGKKAVVVVFLSFECPVASSYAQPLADLAKAYQEQGVAFLGVCGPEEEPAQIQKRAREFEIPFPVLRDDRQAAADAFQAEVTPEAFVLDAGRVLRYRGRIDDRYVARLRQRPAVTRHDLRRALDEVLAGKAVGVPATPAVGCALPRTRPTPAATGTVVFHRDVLPILQTHCQGCHRPGEVAPFSLMTYRQAVTWAADIKDYTRSRKMPPWKPTDGVPFHGERRLTEREIATLAAWVDGGTPEGDPAAAPAPRRFADGWQLGEPDLVLTLSDDFRLGAGGGDLYRCFVLPTGLPEDRYVTAVEVRPGNRRVVHHAVLFVDASREGRKLEEKERQKKKVPEDRDSGPGYTVPMSVAFLPGFLPQAGMGGWTPGQIIRHLPAGTGLHLPKGADLVMQLHYHRSGRPEKDRTSVGLYFARKPVERRVQGVAVPGHFLFIPAGAERFKVSGSVWIQQDCHLHVLGPHMHLLGREIKLTMVPPGGRPRTLIAINDWDFNWQEAYFLKQSLGIKAGTRFDVEGIYDNSARNPQNPHRPPRSVFVGLETTDEMCLGVLGVTADKPGRVSYIVQPRIQGWDWKPEWGFPVPGL
jgi:peroxiredoxin